MIRSMFIECLWKCFEFCKKIPIIFVVAIVSWSYYVYLFQYCFDCLGSVFSLSFQFIPYHILIIMFSWSFIMTVYTPIQKPPENFFTAADKLHNLEGNNFAIESRKVLLEASINLPVLCRNFSGAIRYCNVCKCFKPDRCHHCSICRKCVLKMDHHCPWVNNCVGYSNYKFFLLFLWYGLLYCLFVSISLYNMSIQMISETRPKMSMNMPMQLLFLWLLSSLFALGLAILSIMHLYLMLVNKSTLELFQSTTLLTGPKKKGFNLGFFRNFLQVFGTRMTLWPIPVFTSLGNGVVYPLNPVYAAEAEKAVKALPFLMAEEGLMQV